MTVCTKARFRQRLLLSRIEVRGGSWSLGWAGGQQGSTCDPWTVMTATSTHEHATMSARTTARGRLGGDAAERSPARSEAITGEGGLETSRPGGGNDP